jgi:hypothetical protein
VPWRGQLRQRSLGAALASAYLVREKRMALDKHEQWHIFASLGEATVRKRVARGIFADDQLRLAQEWLEQQDQGNKKRAADREISTDRDLHIVRSKRAAMWVAAIVAVALMSAAAAIFGFWRR